MTLRVCLLAAAIALPSWNALPAFAESSAIAQNAQFIEPIRVAGVIQVDDSGMRAATGGNTPQIHR